MVQTVRSRAAWGEFLVDAMGQFVECGSRVAAACHHGRAGVILLPAECEADAAQSNDARDDADLAPAILEIRALLDVRFDKTGIAAGHKPLARHVGQPRFAQRLGECHTAMVDRPLLHLRRQRAGQGTAAEAAHETRLLVLERHRIHREVTRGAIRGERANHLQPIDHAERAIEPAPGGLRVGVRANQQRLAGIAGAPDHVANAIDRRVEPRLFITLFEPAARLHVLRTECRPHDTLALCADAAQVAQVGEQAFRIDTGHETNSNSSDASTD
jgi:hypothetical protein